MKLDAGSLNFRHLRVFCEVSRAHGISAAADRVHLSQPAMTQAIAKLEAQLGVNLFERRKNGMFPTEVGEAFHSRARVALDQLAAGTREISRPGRTASANSSFDRLITNAQVRALVALAESTSFSMAARQTGVSQPSMHRAARDLESLAGVTLFRTSAEGVTLTQAAQTLALRANLALAELRQGVDEIGAWLDRDATSIAVGSLPLARTSILPEAIRRIALQTRTVQIRVVDGPYASLLHALRHGKIDFLIGALRNPLPADDVVQEKLFDDPLALVAGAGHPLLKRDRVTLADTLDYPWVAPPRETPAGTYLYETLRIHERPQTPVRVVSSSLVLLRKLLVSADFITIISLHQIDVELQAGMVAPLPIALTGNSRPIGLTFRSGWRPTPTQSRFLDHVRDAAGEARRY